MKSMPRLKKALIACIPNVKLTTKVPFGGKIHFFARTHKGFLVRRVTDYPHEACIFRYYEESLSPDSIVFDVGANIGLHTVPLSLLTPRGRVVAFEPDQENVRLLEENVARNHLAHRVTLVPMAVSDTSGTVAFWRDVVSSSTGTIEPRGQNSWYHEFTGRGPMKVEVSATTIDDYLHLNPTLVPQLIKIDVEGAEARVLDGMRETAHSRHPDIIIDGTPVESARRLFDMGYDLFDLETRARISDANAHIPFTILATARHC